MIRRYTAELRALLILSDALLAGAVFAVVSWLPFGAESKSYWSGVIRPTELGLAQIEARSYREFDQEANMDLQYIDRWSPWLDFRILIRTVRVLFRTNGR